VVYGRDEERSCAAQDATGFAEEHFSAGHIVDALEP
jgi:hypothetical protein